MGIKQRCGFFRIFGKMRIPQQGIRNKRQKTAKRRQRFKPDSKALRVTPNRPKQTANTDPTIKQPNELMLWGLRPAGRGCLLFGCFLCFHHLLTLFVLCFFSSISSPSRLEQKFLTTGLLGRLYDEICAGWKGAYSG